MAAPIFWNNFRLYLREFEWPILKYAVSSAWNEYVSLDSLKKDAKIIVAGWVCAAIFTSMTDAAEQIWWVLMLGPCALGVVVICTALWRLFKGPYRLYRKQLAEVASVKVAAENEVREAKAAAARVKHSSAAFAAIKALEKDIQEFEAAEAAFNAQCIAALERFRNHKDPEQMSCEHCYLAAKKLYEHALKGITVFAERYNVKWPDEYANVNPPEASEVIEPLRKKYRDMWLRLKSDGLRLGKFRSELNLNGRLYGEKKAIEEEGRRKLRGEAV